MTARIEPLPCTGNPPELQALVDTAVSGTGGAQNIFLTFARNPGLFRRYLPLGSKLLGAGKLPAREREIAILRTAKLCNSAYEWGQHVRIGDRVGVSEELLLPIAAGPGEPSWNEADATLLRAVDQLVNDHTIDQPTWSSLTGRFDEAQLIELTVLVGHHVMLAGMLNAVGVEAEPGLAAFPVG